MEKSSEKIITRPPINPFDRLMSQVHLRLPPSTHHLPPSPNYALQLESQVDRHSEQPHFFLTPRDEFDNEQPPSILRKNREGHQTEKNIQTGLIQEWICGYMLRRQILGEHWHFKIQQKNQHCLRLAMENLKNFERPIWWGRERARDWSITRKCQLLAWLHHRMETDSVHTAFVTLFHYYKDSSLFGLSRSNNQDQESSSQLCLQSHCRAPTGNLKFSNSISEKQELRQGQQSVSYTDDLSKLILNYNKVNLISAEMLSSSIPNIPKPRASSKKIPTVKSFKQLKIDSRKRMSSEKQMGASGKDLPLDSFKKLAVSRVNSSKLIPELSLVPEAISNEPVEPESLTLVMQKSMESGLKNNLDHTRQNKEVSNMQPSGCQSHRLQSQNRSRVSRLKADPNAISRVRQTESVYEQIKIESGRQQLQSAKPFAGIIVVRRNTKKGGKIVHFPQQKSQQSGNYKLSEMRNQELSPQNRSRAVSATPRIVFTFSPSRKQEATTSSAISLQNMKQQCSKYKPDAIKEDSLLVSSILSKDRKSGQQKLHQTKNGSQVKLQSSAPSRKLLENNRQHINERLLPSVSPDVSNFDYYGDPERISGDHYASANQLVMSGCNSPCYQSGHGRAADKYLTRMKSSKQKLLVVSASKLLQH